MLTIGQKARKDGSKRLTASIGLDSINKSDSFKILLNTLYYLIQINRSYTIESCSAIDSCHVLIEQSEEQRNPFVGIAHAEDFESLPDSDGALISRKHI